MFSKIPQSNQVAKIDSIKLIDILINYKILHNNTLKKLSSQFEITTNTETLSMVMPATTRVLEMPVPKSR